MVICSINQCVLSSGEGLGGLEGPIPRGGSSLCGSLGGRLADWGCGGLVDFGFVLGFHCGGHCGWVGARGSWIC